MMSLEGRISEAPRLRPSLRLLSLAMAVVFASSVAAQEDRAAGRHPETERPASAGANAWAESKIWSSYALDTHLNPFEISVDVEGGLAIISGEVDEASDRVLAEQLALKVEEIVRVENRIIVVDAAVGDSPPRRDVGDVIADSAITAAVKSRLLWNERTDGFAINVDTAQGRVRLTGEADNEIAVQTAGRLAMDTDGVLAVDNQLVVVADPALRTTALERTAETIDDAWITTKVKSSLMYSQNVDGLDLSVSTSDGRVKLAGSVSSAAERDIAIRIARDVRGVREVDATAVAVAVAG